mgnify:CR=1 FL=1
MLSLFETFLATVTIVLSGVLLVLLGQTMPAEVGGQIVALGTSLGGLGLFGVMATGTLIFRNSFRSFAGHLYVMGQLADVGQRPQVAGDQKNQL